MRLAESRDLENFTKGAHFYWNVKKKGSKIIN